MHVARKSVYITTNAYDDYFFCFPFWEVSKDQDKTEGLPVIDVISEFFKRDQEEQNFPLKMKLKQVTWL